ncbi:MAG: D-glycerate dehydrogenase [Candidatus Pacebacteria bacterium]|nr:D-glycerate dehydrogenase [Candidatus Paceibacterota bacterium]MCF7862705.1 D-glycerate dehydrogenase [Candidatus Paceibacterota bacterium]
MNNQHKIYITRKIPEIAEQMLKAKGYIVEVNPKDENLSKRKLIKILKKGEYTAVLSLLTDQIDQDVCEASKGVKIFSNYATGFDNINIEEAKKMGIMVANSPAPLTPDAVAEQVIAFMFALGKKIVDGDRFIRDGKYKGWVPMLFLGSDLQNKTLGLVGGGRIGEKTAQMASALGLKIIYTDIKRNENLENNYKAEYVDSIEKLLSLSDFVSLHVPLLPSTTHLMNEKTFALMKPTAYLINTARGAVIDEVALVKALESKTIAGAGLDVFEFEPKVNSRLKKLPNTILTPHIASASVSVRNQMAEISAQNIIDCLEGRTPKYIIN